MGASRYARRFGQWAMMLGLLVLLLAGCDFGANQSDLARDQTLKMLWTASVPDIPIFDPAQAYDLVGVQLSSLLFDGLVTLNRNGEIEPWAASGWTMSADTLAYTFTLRPNLRFSDGAPVRPSDYAWSIDRVANPCTQSYLAYYLAAFRDATAFSAETCASGVPQGRISTLVGDSILPDDGANTLTLLLARPAGYVLNLLTTAPFVAIERSVVTMPGLALNDDWTHHMAEGKTGQGGGGMFYVSQRTHDNHLILRLNPNWWGRQLGKVPHFTSLDITTVASPNPSLGEFVGNSSLAFADSIVDLPPNLPLAATKRQSYYHEQPALSVETLLLNWKIAPFDDLNARKAFCLAVNRDQINQQVYAGTRMSTWHLIPEGLQGYNAHLRGLDDAPVGGNLALAQSYWRRYLRDHPDRPRLTRLTVLFEDGFADQRALEAKLQVRLSQLVGSRLTFIPFQIPHVLGVAPGWEYIVPLSHSYWSVDYPDPQDFLSTLYTSDSQYDTQNARVPAADTLMRQADALSDMAQRIPRYQQAEQLLIDNVAVCPLFQRINRYALRTWVKGDFREDARGIFPNDAWLSGYIARH